MFRFRLKLIALKLCFVTLFSWHLSLDEDADDDSGVCVDVDEMMV